MLAAAVLLGRPAAVVAVCAGPIRTGRSFLGCCFGLFVIRSAEKFLRALTAERARTKRSVGPGSLPAFVPRLSDPAT